MADSVISAREAREAILADLSAPTGLKILLSDKVFCGLHNPTAQEMEIVRGLFGQFGDGTKTAYIEAFNLLRRTSLAQARAWVEIARKLGIAHKG